MKIAYKHKVYVAVVGAGVAALLIDRAYFTPAAASASPAADEILHPSKVEAAALPDASAGSDGMITTRLNAVPLPDFDQLTDAFTPSKTWVGTVEAPNADFAAGHKLSAVLASRNGGGAIVNGQLVRVGQGVDGFILISVGARAARFCKSGITVELTLAP